MSLSQPFSLRIGLTYFLEGGLSDIVNAYVLLIFSSYAYLHILLSLVIFKVTIGMVKIFGPPKTQEYG